jgi:hypothetical protein
MKKQRDLINTTRHGSMSESTVRNKKIFADFHLPPHYRKKTIGREVFTIYHFYYEESERRVPIIGK